MRGVGDPRDLRFNGHLVSPGDAPVESVTVWFGRALELPATQGIPLAPDPCRRC